MQSKTALLTFIIIAISGSLFGQKNAFRTHIYFETSKYEITATGETTLNSILDSLKEYQTYSIYIKGHTDNVGDSNYNKNLSEKRVQSTVNFLLEKGISKKAIKTGAFGMEKPIADNQTEEGKEKNRRVDIAVSYSRKIAVDSSTFLPSIFELYALTTLRPSTFCIDPTRDTILRCEKGSLVLVKANSFKINKKCTDNCLTIKVKEALDKADMILENLSTTSNGQLIETQGMVYTQATDCKGNNLNLQKGKELIILIPADTILPNTQIFQGNRTPHDSVMNWTVNNNSLLSDFSISELNNCESLMGKGVMCFSCERCRFFFCRIKRLNTSLLGIVLYDVHVENYNFRQCQRTLRRERRRVRRENKNEPLPTEAKIDLPPSVALNQQPALEPKCRRLKDLFEQYNVSNLSSLTEAINQPLLDSFGVKTMEELRDTLAKISARDFEVAYLNKTISYEDFKYYVFNTNRLGWSNIDVFVDINQDSLVDMKIDLKIAKNVDCKIVFVDRQFVIPAEKTKGKYIFENLPKGERVWIVALKYHKNKAYLSLQQTTIDNITYTVDLKELTLEELKTALSKINN